MANKHPFLDPESYLDYGIKIKDYKPKEKQQELSLAGGTQHSLNGQGIGTGSIRKNTNGNFLFFDVPYQDRVIECIERPMAYVDTGNQKTQAQHLEWLLDKKNNPGGYTLVDMELEYQLCRMSFDLRLDSTCGTLANEYIAKIRTLYDSWLVSADHIQYGNSLEAVITNKGSIASNPKEVFIPEYENGYFALSNQRPEAQLNQINLIDSKIKRFLKTYLGFEFERAGEIFSYCASRKNNNLRETRVWTAPDWEISGKPFDCVGGLGIDGDDEFGIGAYDYVARPALVVAQRAKNLYGK